MKQDFKVEETYQVVLRLLRKHISKPNCVDVLEEVAERLNSQYVEYEDEVKKRLSRDFMRFFEYWFLTVKDAEKCSPNGQSILLNINTIDPWRFFKDIYVRFNKGFMVNLPEDNTDEGKLVRLINICIKAVIQTKKRTMGMETPSKKYPVEK
jgi:hypothetical protein